MASDKSAKADKAVQEARDQEAAEHREQGLKMQEQIDKEREEREGNEYGLADDEIRKD